MERQDCMVNQDSRSHESKPTSVKENCPCDDLVSGSHWMNASHAKSVELQSSINLVSGNSGRNLISSPFSNENASSTIVLGENMKDYDASTLSSNGISGRVHSARSDVSSEAAPPTSRGTDGVDAGKSNGGPKHMTESSCSNSTLTVLPVCSSSESYQELSTDVTPEHHAGGSSNSIPTGFDSSTVEPVTNHAGLDIAAQITQKAVDRVIAWSQMQVSESIKIQNGCVFDAANSSISNIHEQRSDNEVSQDKQHSLEGENVLGAAKRGSKCSEQKIDTCSGASGSTSLDEEHNALRRRSSYVCFENPNNFICLTKTKGEAPTLKGEDCGASHRHIVHHESYKHQPFSRLQNQSKDSDQSGLYGHNGLFCVEKSSESIMAKPTDVVSKGNTARPDLFDLNEDIYRNEPTSNVQSAWETRYPCNVIRVVAKPGVPSRVPMTPLKFHGQNGFKVSAAFSAFSPTHLKRPVNWSDSSSKHAEGFVGIDLNVAVTEDDSACESQLDFGRASIPLIQVSSLKAGSRGAERLGIDLNCLGDSLDIPRASLPVTVTKTPMVDINLNEDPSCADIRDHVHQQYTMSQYMARMKSDSPALAFASSVRDSDLNHVRPACWSDFSSIQFYGQAQTRPPYLVAAPNALRPMEQVPKVVQLQPKLPYVMQTLPSQSYPSTGPFFFYPNGSVIPSVQYSSPVQYARDPRVHINHGMLPAFGAAPHLVQVPRGRSQNEVANSRATTDGNSAVNGSLRETRQYLYPSRCSTVEEQVRPVHQPVVSGATTPLKRAEPDGGHDAYQQLATRQLTSWN